jgi:hypothetical protein
MVMALMSDQQRIFLHVSTMFESVKGPVRWAMNWAQKKNGLADRHLPVR